MNKIKSLLVLGAMLVSGTMWATESFPAAGTYFVTFTGQATDGRNNCLYNDLTQPDGYTLQAATKASPLTNAFIWKAVCDGTNMTIVNGQGSTMKLKNNSGDRTFNVINYVAHNNNYYLKPVLSSGTLSANSHDCLNVSNGGYTNAANTPCLTSWSTVSGPNAGDNHWAVDVVDVTGLNEYTVTVTGADGYVNYGEQKAANGGFFLAASISVDNLTASRVSGKDATVTMSGNAINVVYTEKTGLDWDAFEDKLNQLSAYTLGEGLGKYADIEKYSEDLESDTPLSAWLMYFALDLGMKVEDRYDADMENMQWFLDRMTLNMPKAGSFLRLKGVDNNTKYLLGTLTNSGTKFAMGTAKDATSVFYYDGTGLVSYHTGRYVGTTSSKWQWNVGEGSAITFYDASTMGAYRIRVPKDSGNKDFVFLYSGAANANTTDRGGFGSLAACTDTKYQWTLEDVTALPVSVSAAGFATLYAPVALTIPADVEAYTLAFDGTYLQATAVEGTIPANTGVVLKANEGSYDFAITTGGTASSELSGTVPAIAKVEGALVLGLDEEENVGFYTPAESVANFAGFKAYYVPTGGESNLRISFSELTGIISAAQQNGGQAIFDLQGRRVVEAKGLNIVNGKKVIR